MNLVRLFDELGEDLSILCYFARAELDAEATPTLFIAHER
jgi:hypothetical protein